jgi:mono/diheme cytochrome c family protein
MFRTASLLAGSVACLIASQLAASVPGPGARVDNFRLLDHRGRSHELHYLSDQKAVLLVVQTNDCAALRKEIPQLEKLRQQYAAQSVAMFMLNSNPAQDRDSIGKFAAETGSQTPVLMDGLQLIGESLGATRAGEVLVIDPKNWTLAYRGSLQHAAAALDAVVAGQPVKQPQVAVKGCRVALPELAKRAAHAGISYSKAVAPVLAENCASCHKKGGIAPWQMTDYNIVKGFAPMIREVLRTQRMPPWHADPHYGTFKNNRALSDEQVKTLVHWVEAGAPRDSAADPLTQLKFETIEWQHGKPDAIVELAPFNVPATGTIDYQRPEAANPIQEDVWLRAIEFLPGDRSVVHHMLAYNVPASASGRNAAMGGSYLGGYVPGATPIVFPNDTGIFLPKGSKFAVQMHYTASGKPATDVTRIALYYTKEAPKYPLRNMVLANPTIRIPPNTKEYTSTQSRVFDRDVLVYSLTAHAHFRGNSANYVATYPDGRQETLLSVPRYDFNWQTTYELAEPKVLPKGTKLVYTASYDNSPQNKANPDPNIEVRWGEQSWEEMLYGNVRLRYLDEVVPAQTAAN